MSQDRSNSGRRLALIIGLSSRSTAQETSKILSPFFDVREIPEIHWDVEYPKEVDIEVMAARLGRAPLEGEIGCALAHRNACEQLIKSGASAALVLENDAQVVDAQDFLKVTEQAFSAAENFEGLVSLYAGEELQQAYGECALGQVVNVPFRPSYALGYVISTGVAKKVVELQTPVRDIADWPKDLSKDNFLYIPQSRLRPDPLMTSSIDAGRIRFERSVRQRLEIASGIWFFKHRRQFRSLKNYGRMMLVPRIQYRVWHLRQKLPM